tara:strand:+ start:19793 stop:20608 length:816 start_codon:yes stop_codon:yes gene_type:complete
MIFQAKRLNRHGYTVSVPQLAGHCQDDAALLATRWEDWYVSVESAYERLKEETDEVSVAGICVGGALGLVLASRHSDVRAAAVYSMIFDYDGWNMPRWYALAPVMSLANVLPPLNRIQFEEPYPFGLKDARLRERLQSKSEVMMDGALTHMSLGSLRQMRRLVAHVRDVSPSIRQPVLVVHSTEDDMAHPRNSEALVKILGGPTELLLLKDSYHMIHIDKERNLVADRTASFFDAAARGAAYLSGKGLDGSLYGKKQSHNVTPQFPNGATK